jgi:hypothetical protein
MDILKLVFPFSFKVKEKNVTDLVVTLIIYVVLAVVGGLLLGLLSWLPILGVIFIILGSLLDLYALIGIALAILNFFNLLK